MKHTMDTTKQKGRTIYTYGEKKHGGYYVTINAHEQGYAWMAVWYCDEEAGDCDVATEFGMTMHKVELRRAAGRMMARLCEGGYHLDAIRLLTDLVQDVA